MSPTLLVRRTAAWGMSVAAALLVAGAAGTPAGAQEDQVTPIDMAVGRSLPLTLPTAITKVSVANPDIADVVVISTLEMVINARAPGETDAIIWQEGGGRKHYRVVVKSAAQRRQIVVGIEFAEVDRNLLRDLGVSGVYRDAHNQVSTNLLQGVTGGVVGVPGGEFISVLTDFDTQHLLGLLQSQEQSGRSRMLAEPTVMAGDREPADFLAGGEVPIPVVQTGGTAGAAGGAPVTIQYKEFGIKLHFVPEILNDTLIRLAIRPEVSSLDFANAITLSGFKIPALSTRRVESTVDVRRGESLILSGMFNETWSRNRTGIPFLMSIPIIGQLFSSTQWQHNRTELLIVVTPIVVDPNAPPARTMLPVVPDTTLPAADAIRPRLAPPSEPPTSAPPR